MIHLSNNDLETLAVLYALGHLHDAERAAFEAALQDAQSPATACLQKFQPVVEALSWATPKEPPPTLRTRLLERVRQEERLAPVSERITLAPGLMLVLADRLTWQDTAVPGVRYKPLFLDAQRRHASLLVSIAPGTIYPPHRHMQVEELFMLTGDLQIGPYRLGPGDYSRAEAGTSHEPVRTATGCTCIVLASLDDELLAAEPEEAGQARAAAPSPHPLCSGEHPESRHLLSSRPGA